MTSADEPIGGVHVVCAWCGVVVAQGTGDWVSHGICPDCTPRVLAQVSDRLATEPVDPYPGPAGDPVQSPLEES